MSTTSLADPAAEVADRAWAAYRRVRRHFDERIAERLEQEAGISPADFDVLHGVRHATTECVRVGGLADDIGWSRSRLSRQLSRLERRGLVAREPCERDGRGDDVLLTDDGRDAVERAEPLHRDAVLALVGSAESSGLFPALESFAKAIEPS